MSFLKIGTRLVKKIKFRTDFCRFLSKPAQIEKELGLQLAISSVFFPDPSKVKWLKQKKKLPYSNLDSPGST